MCLDKYKGPENLAPKKTVVEPTEEDLDVSKMSRYSRASANVKT